MSPDTALYSVAQVRQLDHRAIEDYGIPATVLMKRAGQAAFNHLLQLWPEPNHLQVLCGGGNNGGDGYVIAALAAQRKLPVVVWQLSDRLAGAAKAARDFARQEGVPIKAFNTRDFQAAITTAPTTGVLVDALLGTGATGSPRGSYVAAIEAINSALWPVLAVDIPSGVNADNGSVAKVAVNADATVSFIGQKLGNLVGRGRVCSGRRLLAGLDVPADLYTTDSPQPLAGILSLQPLRKKLPVRPADAHKGDFGHVLVVGGDYGFGGAPLMAAQMAARAGAGLVSVATRPANTSAIVARQPELMAAGVQSGQEFLPLLSKPSTLVIGPGLGRSSWSEQLLYHCLHGDKPAVLDADALNLIARMPLELPDSTPWILTPHPGEAARLLDVSVAVVQSDRVAAVRELQARYGGTVVLKGAGTLVLTAAANLWVCDAGNPAMASGGMGDVLSGLLGALLAQGLSPDDAACLGVLAHAMAADRVVSQQGSRGLLATDLIEPVRHLLDEADE